MNDQAAKRRTFGPDTTTSAMDHEVLEVARVVRVVKGGRRFRFRAGVIVGNRNGKVGFGVGKSKDVQQAIQKAQDQAEKHSVQIDIVDGSLAHSIKAKHKGAMVMLRPAKPGTGVIAGGTMRTVADLAGVRDMVGKRLGSNNKVSNAMATIKALAEVSAKGLAEKKVSDSKAGKASEASKASNKN